MQIEHRGSSPNVHPTAYVAPTAVLCGDVRVGPETRILFGAVAAAEGGPVEIGARCIVMENAVIRGSGGHPVRIADRVLVGPRAYLTGCTVEEDAFVATGATVFNGALIGRGAEVRINSVVHLLTVLPAGATVPIGWVAVGDPAQILPPGEHDRIWAIQRELNFSREVWGLDPPAEGQTNMPEITRRYSKALARHLEDQIVDP
jgi:carbonic anhydrase/acetyltransferase-like protein (isoleucine patch superfamily)